VANEPNIFQMLLVNYSRPTRTVCECDVVAFVSLVLRHTDQSANMGP